jgi:N-acetylmuramic acid 6-phosphate etherase
MSTAELVQNINKEDQTVAEKISENLDSIAETINAVYDKMKDGGRLFYIGAGTSGRLGIVDASECPPTFGVPHDWVIGLIAGGDSAIRKAVEFAEDDLNISWKDLSTYGINDGDFVIGIAASGTTPYVISGLEKCKEMGILTGCIVCNPDSPIAAIADFPIEIITGPEFVTGSTRMKAGTAQKLVLNMITTSVMIKLGRVVDNKMVDMQLSNNKLVDRGSLLIQKELGISYEKAKALLLETGSVRKALESKLQ